MISSRFIQLVAMVLCAYACLDIQAQAVTGPLKPNPPSSNVPPHLGGMTGDNNTNNPNGLNPAPRQNHAPSVPSSGAKQIDPNPSKTMNNSQTKTADMAKPNGLQGSAKPVGPGPVGNEKVEGDEDTIPAGAEGLAKRGGLRDVLWKRDDLPSVQGIGKKTTSLKENNTMKKPDQDPGAHSGGGKRAAGQSKMAGESSGYVAGSSTPDHAGKNKSGRNKLMLSGGSGSSEPAETIPSSEGDAAKNKQGGVHATLNERAGKSTQHRIRKRQEAGIYKTKFKTPKLGGGTSSGVAVGTFGGPPVPINGVPINGVMSPTGPMPLPTAIVPLTPVGGNGMGGMPPMLGGAYF